MLIDLKFGALHKTDSVTGKGIQGVTFLLYDSTNKPIGQYTTDNTGYIYIDARASSILRISKVTPANRLVRSFSSTLMISTPPKVEL